MNLTRWAAVAALLTSAAPGFSMARGAGAEGSAAQVEASAHDAEPAGVPEHGQEGTPDRAPEAKAESPPTDVPVAPETAEAKPDGKPKVKSADKADTRPPYEGAIGIIASHGAAFPGSSDKGVKFQPGGFVRWGRVRITGAGGFTTRNLDEVERGLVAEIVQRPTWHVSVGLRLDTGRQESDSGDLAGMGTIPATARGRLAFRWEPVPDWRLGASASFDLLNKVGGVVGDFGISRLWRFGPERTLSVGASISAGDESYMQTWHGVTAEQSTASGYPVYSAQAGLRDTRLAVIWRQELGRHWTAMAAAGVSRLLGPAAESPLTRDLSAVAVQAGIAWRF